MSRHQRMAAVLGLCAATLATAQVARFDTASGELLLPTVAVGSVVYADVRLKDQGGLVFGLQSAVQAVPGGPPGAATFDVAADVLRIPQVRVGAQLYRDVTLQHRGDYRFALQGAVAATLPAPVPVPARWQDVWLDSGLPAALGGFIDLRLYVASANGAGALQPVASIGANFSRPLAVQRVWGGHYQPLTQTLTDVGARQLIVRDEIGGRALRVRLDKTADGLPPQAQVLPASCAQPALQAQSATGDEVVLSCGGTAYLYLGPSGEVLPFVQPAWPGASVVMAGAPHLGHTRHPDTGALTGLLWSATGSGRTQLLRTDAQGRGVTQLRDFGLNAAVVQTLVTARAVYLLAGETLLRLDAATGRTTTVRSGVRSLVSPLMDGHSLMATITEASGRSSFIRCLDHEAATCATLFEPGRSFAESASGLVAQTPQHLLLPGTAPQVRVVRKADGAHWAVQLPDALSSVWMGAHPKAVLHGERVPYQRTVVEGGRVRSRVGSLDLQGGDRREHDGLALRLPGRWPDEVPALVHNVGADAPQLPSRHQLLHQDLSANRDGSGPYQLLWWDLATGDLGPALGSVTGLPLNDGANWDRSWNSSQAGATGVLAASRYQPLEKPRVPLQAWRLGTTAGSLQPLLP